MAKARDILWHYTPLLILAVLWEAVTEAHLVSPYALPPLSSVIFALFRLLGDDLVLQTTLSVVRGAAGLAAAIVFGTFIGVLMAWSVPVRMLANPVIRMFYPLPKAALIPVSIIWLGLGDVSKITLIFLGCLLPIVVSSFNAARGVDHLLIWSARSQGATDFEILREIVFPAALPEILNGYRVALALCFILVVAGEIIFANNGIGYLISSLGDGGDYEGMFACVIAISLVGFAADRLSVAGIRRLLIWRE
jgi:ABC-type nitrate/sulfonate/bicarbonate transport system permease component